jgi:hypothetical protein
VRADLREVTRRIEQLDWLTNKAESGLDQIKEDVESLKRSVEGNGGDFFLSNALKLSKSCAF